MSSSMDLPAIFKTNLLASKDERIKKYNQCVNWMSSRRLHSGYILITRLGMPEFTEEISTASVQYSGDRILFKFNPKFFDDLTPNQLIAVLLHEALHILLEHVSNHYGSLFPSYWNYATDAVINDTIQKFYSDKDIELPGKHITGKGLIEKDCSEMTATEVYDILMKKNPPMKVILELETIDDHRNWGPGEKTPEMSEKLEDILVKIKQTNDKYMGHDKDWQFPSWLYGKHKADMKRNFEIIPHTMNPYDILKKLVNTHYSSVLPEWNPPNNKLITFFPKFVIPRWETSKKARVLFAVDASGSISPKWIDMFMSIINSCKSFVESEIVSFDTITYPFSKKTETIGGGGGTDIQSVENYIIGRQIYPANIIVLSDGIFGRPFLKYPERWLFLLERDINLFSREYFHQIPDFSKVMLIPKP